MSQQPIPMRVLVIDDDPTFRGVLALLLESENFFVESADSGEAALILLRRPQPAFDLVLVDVQMPGMIAAELAHKLRLACGPETLLLSISGSQPSAQLISLFDGFLLKPFGMEQVIAVLRARSNSASDQGQSPAVNAAEFQELTSAESIGSGIHASVLNETIYRQLSNTIPTPQLQEMYALCVNDTRKRIAGMRALVAANATEEFTREAHSIKGGCGMLGATELHSMAAELETNGLHSSLAGAAQDGNSLDELSAACDRLERMLSSRV